MRVDAERVVDARYAGSACVAVRALRSAGRAYGDARLFLVTLDASPPPRPLPDRIVWTPAARWLLEDVG